ncbi:MAG: M24 family metallopeptidase [Gemmatimonadaceae bacterium]
MLTADTLPGVQAALADAGLDGWLLFDFRGANPIATGMMGLDGMVTRRVFAFIPRSGSPVALTHPIEQGPWRHWPTAWRREVYTSWRVLETLVREIVDRKRIAMEYSPGGAVPYLDRVPGGILDMVRSAGGTIVSSGDLVSRFYATWTATHLAAHRRAAEVIAGIGREAIALAGRRAGQGHPLFEHELAEWIRAEIAGAGLESDHGPVVASGPNAADPHYAPSTDRPCPVSPGNLLLVDLWGREPGAPYADQTWMGAIGEPSPRALDVWTTVREARDAAIALLVARSAAKEPIGGAALDDAARAVITRRGYAASFTHRTGHSIDPRSLHGAGPNLDNLETRDDRLLLPGIAFSIEPGVYLSGELGVRSEVNAYVGADGVTITPVEYQRELLVV